MTSREACSLLLALAADQMSKRTQWVAVSIVLLFNLLVLEHNLGAWKYASLKAKCVQAAVSSCLSPSTGRIVVVGLPQSLRGVYFFGSGFPESVRMLYGPGSVPIELRREGKPSTRDLNTCWLLWDDSKDEFRHPER